MLFAMQDYTGAIYTGNAQVKADLLTHRVIFETPKGAIAISSAKAVVYKGIMFIRVSAVLDLERC